MAAALLTDQPMVLRDVPDLSDIRNMNRLLTSLGCQVDGVDKESRELRLRCTETGSSVAHYDIVRTMRAGICVLGPLLARRGYAKVSMPGGCAIGDRPVDLHIRGLRALGAEIELDEGYIVARSPIGGLQGRRIFLGGPNGSTVLGTANVMSAAVLARGVTVIESAACEPEVQDLANLLVTMGARISGAGTPRVTIEGVRELGGVDYTIIPDRIEAGTYLMAAAITRGRVRLENFPTDSLTALLDRMQEMGLPIRIDGDNGQSDRMRDTVEIEASGGMKPVNVVTQPYPGFPTDLQAQILAMLCMAEGNSIITDKIFPDRFLHVAELLRMGAHLVRSGPTVMVLGVESLIGAPVMASDLRASAGLVLAGLAAKGVTTVNRVYHLDRGYERMEASLNGLGAQIERIDQPAI